MACAVAQLVVDASTVTPPPAGHRTALLSPLGQIASPAASPLALTACATPSRAPDGSASSRYVPLPIRNGSVRPSRRARPTI
jgi:hypothetical protein